MRLAPVWRKRNRDRILVDAWESRQYIDIRGRQVEVARLGQGMGEPIILVPGLAGGYRLLMPLARRLAAHHEIILFDLAGETEPFARRCEDSLSSDALDLTALIRGLGLEQPTVFGISYGGAVALEALVQTPSLAGALVVYGACARFEAGLGAHVARRVLERFPLPSSSPFLNQFFNLLHGGKPQSQSLADFVAERCWSTDAGVILARLRSLESYDVTDHLWRIESPTLVLAGERDVVIPPREQRELAEAIAGARYVRLADAGHVGFLTRGAELSELVAELLETRQRAWL